MRPALALVCVLLASAAALASGSEADLIAGMERARRMLESGSAAEAESAYRELAGRFPGYADAQRGLAEALAAQGRDAAALEILLRVGQGLVHAGSIEEGSALLQRAVEISPVSGAAHAAFGHALVLDSDYDRALDHLRRAVTLGETSPAVFLLMGSAYWEQGDTSRSEESYRRALARSGRSADALQSLGGLYRWQGRFDAAIPLLRESLAADGGSVAARLDLARALDGAGRIDEAIAAYRDVLERAPDLFRAHYSLARLLQRNGDPDAARREMETFQRLHSASQQRTHDTTRDTSAIAFGWELIRTGEPDRAAAHFESLDAGADALSGLAAAHSAAGRHQRAAEALEQALRLDPDRPDLRLRLARERMTTAGRRP
ncbi:MAG: tetratricopeptide repeat protein [bacterium]|nr:tetratricopeptide repeat protein [bacterium]